MNFENFQKKYHASGSDSIAENIKFLLFKNDPRIFDMLDFHDGSIYLEPLLFAYFSKNNKTNTSLDSILYGYIKPDLRPDKIIVWSDRFSRIYLPKLGWLHVKKSKQCYELLTSKSENFNLAIEGKKVEFKFEPLEMIKGTSIELLKYPIPLLSSFYYDDELKPTNVEIENISKLHLDHLNKSWNLIKQLAPIHSEIINLVTKKVVIFNADNKIRNSFASLSAHGIGFFNAYQENYNEVFFVDDIAHQTGHIILNALTYNLKDFIKVDPKTILQTMSLGNGKTETRDVHILFHALYTYYTTFICLDACLDGGAFKNEKKHEAFGRIKFYRDNHLAT